jgi:Mg2+ and Co2+ transporter CorA
MSNCLPNVNRLGHLAIHIFSGASFLVNYRLQYFERMNENIQTISVVSVILVFYTL